MGAIQVNEFDLFRIVMKAINLDPSTIRFHDLDLRGVFMYLFDIIKYALGSRMEGHGNGQSMNACIINQDSRTLEPWNRDSNKNMKAYYNCRSIRKYELNGFPFNSVSN